MRMRDGNSSNATEAFDGSYCFIIKVGDAIPENIPLWGMYKQSALGNSKIRYSTDPYQTWLMLLKDRMKAILTHPSEGCPPWPLIAERAPFIFTRWTTRRRLLT